MNEDALSQLLCTPSPQLIGDIAKIDGDILLLGAGGKIGPSLANLAANAVRQAGVQKKVIAVSRFTDRSALESLHAQGVETISCDLMAPGALNALPDARNVLFLAGRKFGTDGCEALTWMMNVKLPALVADRYAGSNIVAFSTGNVYPMMPIHSGGASEDVPPAPVGEYAMSCLGRERIFEHAAKESGTPVFLYRLNYAIDLQYGVLHDIAVNVLQDKPVSLKTPCFNCIWQGTANEIALRAFLHCKTPANIVNVTGPETVSVRHAAERFGKIFGKTPMYTDVLSDSALLSNAGESIRLFGYPSIGVEEMIDMQAQWLLDGGRTHNKPTGFTEREGKF